MEPNEKDSILLFSPQLLDTYVELEKNFSVKFQPNRLELIFLRIFREIFLNTKLDYKMPDGSIGATRSNWTYLISHCFFSSAKLMDLDCIFETEGKRDSILRTRGASPITILFSEWEWDYNDVFGRGKELDKLCKSVKKDKRASALLFTYVPESEYKDYLIKVIESWKKYSGKKNEYLLALMTVLFSPEKGLRKLNLIRTCFILEEDLIFWEDIDL